MTRDEDETRVVWLLDVDGVLNAHRPGWGAPPRTGNAHSGPDQFRIRWAPALVARILAVHEAGLAQIRWCTTWCADVDQIEALLGLPRFERAWTDFRQGPQAAIAKIEAAHAVLARGDRLVWTDDDAIPSSGPDLEKLTGGRAAYPVGGGWTPHTGGGQTLTSGDGRVLLVAPSPVRGLQPGHLDQIEEFLRA
jgi:hypothetical protein